MASEEKMKALDAALAQIEKQYGKGSVMKLGDQSANMGIDVVPTGSLSLDLALGLGGMPRGRIIEIYGPESSGKTTVALHVVAEVQKMGGIAGFIDAEHALDPTYAAHIGVDIDNLYISQPDNGEQALEITETMVRSGAVDIIIVDSVAALVPKAEIDGDMVEAVCALDMKRRGCLPEDTVVSTVMCNLGFVHAMRDNGITVVQTKVGDRYVLEEMRAKGYAIGGEQSGHMILLEHNSTGDGLMTACQFLAAVKRADMPVADVVSIMKKFPQTLINVRVRDKHAVEGNEAIAAAVAKAEEALGDSGRVLLRPSGTEPVVRVMVEAEDADAAKTHAKAIAAVVEAEI